MQKYLEKFAAVVARNKRVFVFALPLIILFSVFPPAHAEAIAPLVIWALITIGGIAATELFSDVSILSIVSDAAAPLLEALMWFVNLFVGSMASLLEGIYFAMGNLLHAIITYFISIPVSSSNDALVGFVREAWGFSLLFVNALFLLILVFIGLATILRLQSYQLQKTLPLLIVVALLVNFSGVLVGFVVDISNIITSLFLKASINAAWWTNPFSSLELAAENLGQNIGRILYYMLGTLIYFIVMLLFGVRVIILWTLTILAPLAFASLILPATRTFWTKWWSNLIQWSIIGIPISFFLYLSGKAIGAQFPPAEGTDATITYLITSLFAPLTALVILFVGITLSMQMAPAGASAIINKGRDWGTRTGKWAAREGWRTIGKSTEKLGGNIRKRGQGLEVTPEDQTRLEKLAGSLGGKSRVAGFLGKWALQKTGVAKVVGSGIEIGARAANANVTKKDREGIARGEKAVGKIKGEGIRLFVQSKSKTVPLSRDTSVEDSYITTEIKNKNVKGIRKAIADGIMSQSDIVKLYRNTVANGNDDERELLEKAFPELAFDDKKNAQGNVVEGSNTFGTTLKNQEKIMENYDDKDVTDKILTLDTFTQHNSKTGEAVKDSEGNIQINEELLKMFLQKGNRRLFQKILEKGDREETVSLWKYIEKLGSAGLAKIGREDIVTWSRNSPAARNLGLNEIPDVPEEGIEELEGTKTKLQGDALSIGKEISDLKAEIVRLREEIKTSREDIKTKPGSPVTISPIDRDIIKEKIQQDEDTIQKSERQIGIREEKLEEIQKDTDKIDKKIEKKKKKGPDNDGNGTGPAPAPPLQPSGGPRGGGGSGAPPIWLNSGIQNLKSGGAIPVLISQQLEQYLKDQGLTQAEINSLTPRQAWEKAEELSAPTSTGAATPTLRKSILDRVASKVDKSTQRVLRAITKKGDRSTTARPATAQPPRTRQAQQSNASVPWQQASQTIKEIQSLSDENFDRMVKGGTFNEHILAELRTALMQRELELGIGGNYMNDAIYMNLAKKINAISAYLGSRPSTS